MVTAVLPTGILLHLLHSIERLHWHGSLKFMVNASHSRNHRAIMWLPPKTIIISQPVSKHSKGNTKNWTFKFAVFECTMYRIYDGVMGGGGKCWDVAIVVYAVVIPKVTINIEKHLNGAGVPPAGVGDTCSFVDKHVKATIMSYAKSQRSRYINMLAIKYFCWFY